MIGWLKRLVAGRELDELERWRVTLSSAERWLAEFTDVTDALAHVRVHASGKDGFEWRHYSDISRVRERMRNRRAISGYQPVCKGPMPPPPGPRDATDWDVAEREAGESFQRRAFGGLTATEWAARTPEPGGIDYRFLGVTGEES